MPAGWIRRMDKDTFVLRECCEVHHLSYSEWPDHTAPLDPTATVKLLKLTRRLTNNNPVVVHCSGGIGRAVCFIGRSHKNIEHSMSSESVAMRQSFRRQSVRKLGIDCVTATKGLGIDYISQKVKENSNVKMVDMLKDLRNQRFQGVQSIIQYTFIHICVLELFVQDGILPREGKYSEFLRKYVNMLTRYNRRIEAATKEETSKREEKKEKEEKSKNLSHQDKPSL
ncbi:Protein-tyrosine phosphatase [Ostertagia ostertagi]